MFRLNGRTALVTGASRGIGRGIARVLAAAGADVALLARNEALLAEAAGEVRGAGRRALAIAADVRDPDQCRAAVERVLTEWGRLEILINNAGLGLTGPIDSVTEER